VSPTSLILELVAPLLRHGEVHRHEHDGGAVDRERDRDLLEVDVLEGLLHVEQAVHGHAHAAHLHLGHGIVGVESDLGGQVEGDVEAGLPPGDQPFEALVGLSRRAEARVLPGREGTLPVHQGVDSPGERVLPGLADRAPASAGLDVLGAVDRLDVDTGLQARRPRPVPRLIAHGVRSRMKSAMSSKSAPVGKIPENPSSRTASRSSFGITPRDHAADEPLPVPETRGSKRGGQLLEKREVSTGENRDSHRVHVLLQRGGRHLFGRPPEPRVDHLEAPFHERPAHHLGAHVVAVEPQLRDEHPLGHPLELLRELVNTLHF